MGLLRQRVRACNSCRQRFWRDRALWSARTLRVWGAGFYCMEDFVAGVVRVVGDDLKLSASKVDMHADSLRLSHGAADAQIEAAQSGLPAGAAAALGGAMAKWQQESTVHFTRMVDHSTGL